MPFFCRAMERGLAAYQRDLPSSYTEEVHAGALARGLRHFSAAARGPMQSAFELELKQVGHAALPSLTGCSKITCSIVPSQPISCPLRLAIVIKPGHTFSCSAHFHSK